MVCKTWVLADAYGHVVQFEPYQGVKKGKKVASCTKWGWGENVVLWFIEYLPPTAMNNYVTCFRLFTHLGVNNIWATGVLNKNRLRKCTIVGDKQLQKKECGHFGQRTPTKKSSATLTVVYISSSKFSEPKRFVRRLNKIEGSILKNNNQINSTVTTRTVFFPKGWARAFPSTRLVSEWKNVGGPRLLKCSMFRCWMLFFRMHGCCITLIKMKSLSLCLS